jgi:RNA polymerase sigma factor (sigma-70 family)
MKQAELEALPSIRLFELCASCFEDSQYWEEFVRRYNKSLTRCVYHAYRRFSGETHPPQWIVAELLQDTYLKILKNKCASLRRFRGEAEIEAEVYLMQIAISVTVDYLRRQHSLKRHMRVESIEGFRPSEESWEWRINMPNPYTEELAERELIKLLRRTFTGKNSERDILLFMLHFREGLTPQEIAKAKICDLKPTSIAHALERMRSKLRELVSIRN